MKQKDLASLKRLSEFLSTSTSGFSDYLSEAGTKKFKLWFKTDSPANQLGKKAIKNG